MPPRPESSLLRPIVLVTLALWVLIVAAAWLVVEYYRHRHHDFRAGLQPRLERLAGLLAAQQDIAARAQAQRAELSRWLWAEAGAETALREAIARSAERERLTVVALQTSQAAEIPPTGRAVRAVVTLTGDYRAMLRWQAALLNHQPLVAIESAQWMREGGSEQYREHQNVRVTWQLVAPLLVAGEGR